MDGVQVALPPREQLEFAFPDTSAKMVRARNLYHKAVTLPLLYIAGPMLGSGNPYENVGKAIAMADRARDLGWATYIPHCDVLVSIARAYTGVHTTDDQWLVQDFAILHRCDAVCRLDGDSTGADAETYIADTVCMPVFTPDTLPSAEEFVNGL